MNNHSFDRAKEGYVNLLLANQKGSKDPGDSAEMITARREVMDAGYFQDLAASLSQLLLTHLEPSKQGETRLLDIGCGEGFYLQQLHQVMPSLCLQGIDIAKPAVRQAAKRYPQFELAVASSFRLPVDSLSVDVVTRIFAPSDETEVARVLKAGGLFAVVTPAAKHFLQIREYLYEQVRPHAEPECPEGFELLAREHCQYQLDKPEHLQALVAMTPFQWRGDEKQLLLKDGLKVLDFDFHISLYRLI